MKTCVINVYQWKELNEICTVVGLPFKDEKNADMAAIGDLTAKFYAARNRLLRSAGVAYRLRVTMKDKR